MNIDKFRGSKGMIMGGNENKKYFEENYSYTVSINRIDDFYRIPFFKKWFGSR